MAKTAKTSFVCQSCGTAHARWTGKCTACGEWNSLCEEEAAPPSGSGMSGATKGRAVTLEPLAGPAREAARFSCSIAELDRVTGGGIVPGSVIRARTVGVLLMSDEKGFDEKILTVPIDKLNPFYTDVRLHTDLPPLLIEQIRHFFIHYKDLEPGKTSSVGEWAGLDVAQELIKLAIARGKWSQP